MMDLSQFIDKSQKKGHVSLTSQKIFDAAVAYGRNKPKTQRLEDGSCEGMRSSHLTGGTTLAVEKNACQMIT